MANIAQDEYLPDEHTFIIQLYRDYSRLMYYIARKYLNDDQPECEDVVQESLLQFLKHAELLKKLDRARLTNYVAVTVKNTAINAALREKRKTQSTISLSDLSDDFLQSGDSVIDLTIARENRSELLYAIHQLKPEDRILLEGRYYLGYDDRQLAEIFSTTPANIRMRLTRVRRKLLQLMKEPEVSKP